MTAVFEQFSRYRWAVGILLLLVVVVFPLRRPLLQLPATFLKVEDTPVPSDFIYLLDGSIESRPSAAAELFLRGFAPRVVVARVAEDAATELGVFPNESEASRQLLGKLGVPDQAIVVLDAGSGVTSTGDEASELRRYLLENPADRVLVVTNSYHTRGARWLMRRHLSGIPTEIRMVGVADPEFSAANWWQIEAGMLAYFEEYVKFIHNWIYRRPADGWLGRI